MKWSQVCKSLGRRGLLSLAMAVALGLGGVSLTGCNTAEGVGEDIEATGEGVQDIVD